MVNLNITVPAHVSWPTPGNTMQDGFDYGKTVYELSNHLGNVLATITDQKDAVQNGSTGVVGYYKAVSMTQTDYYPFGMQMVGRAYRLLGGYRYGFNGKENDNEVKGVEGSQQDYGMRIYDPRIGKFLSVDPLLRKFPMLTPYQFASNTPIMAIDLDGREALIVTGSASGFFIFGGAEVGGGIAISPSGVSILQTSNLKMGGGVYIGVAANFTFMPDVENASDLEGLGIGFAGDLADYLSVAGSAEYTSAGWAYTLSGGGGAGGYLAFQASFTTVLKTFTWKDIGLFIAEQSANPEVSKFLVRAFDMKSKGEITASDLLDGYKKVVNESVNKRVKILQEEIEESKSRISSIDKSLNSFRKLSWLSKLFTTDIRSQLKWEKKSLENGNSNKQKEIESLRTAQKEVNDIEL